LILGLAMVAATMGAAVVSFIGGRGRHTVSDNRPTRPSPPQVPVKAADSGPGVWGVLIGIDHYRDPAIPACRGAVRDARVVAGWLADTAGWGTDHVLLIDDLGTTAHGAKDAATGFTPTRDDLDRAFREWLPARVRPGDTVVVYFAGQTATPTADGGPVLLPIDARSDDLAGTGWRLDEAIDDLAAAGKNPIVCWLDTSPRGRGQAAPGPQAAPGAAEDWLRRLARWPGVTAWLASNEGPVAESKRAGEPGPFAAALRRGLGTRARPRGLYACLHDMRGDPAAGAGVRTLGGVDPDATLWPVEVRRESVRRQELLLQRGHAAAVSALAFTTDGVRLVTASHDSTVKVWSATSGRLTRSLNYHMVGVTSLDLSHDGRLLATGDGAGRLRLWDLVNERSLPDGPLHARGVARVAFLADGRHVASLDMDGSAWLRDVSSPSSPSEALADGATALACADRDGPLGMVLTHRDGTLRLFDTAGGPTGTIPGPGGLVNPRALATDGRLVAAGDDQGHLLVWDAERRQECVRESLGEAVETLELPAAGPLLVACGKTLHRVSLDNGHKRPTLALAAPANQVAASPDGRWVAAATREGGLQLWGNGETDVALENDNARGETTALAFAPGGRTLVSGDRDGGLRFWSLPDGRGLPGVAGRRGQVTDLSVSADARYLLQISRDGQAAVWDLRDGRALQRLDGTWASGALAADGSVALLAGLETEGIVSVERSTGRPGGVTFEHPGRRAPKVGKLALSRDGKWLAGAGRERGVAWVWELATGRLAATVMGHDAPSRMTAVGFAADGSRLVTAAEDGLVIIHDWDPARVERPVREASRLRAGETAEGDPVPVSAAQVDATGRVAAGCVDGRVVLWEAGSAAPVTLGNLEGMVSAVAFTPDAKWLTAAGADKSVWLFEAGPPHRRFRLDPSPQHAEQVNTLVAWPDSRLFASGSDDTTIRLWDVSARALLGTLSADQDSTDWVAYTPDALFDASAGGESLVVWRDGGELLSLDQVNASHYVFGLTDDLRQARRPAAPAAAPPAPPRLAIDPPRVVAGRPLAELTVATGEGALTDLRLYHNGVPVQSAEDLAVVPHRRFTARVPLRKGVNRFYVMASRAGAAGVEGRSDEVEVRYDGPDSPSRLHVLALGVSRYDDPARRLQFADRDADEMANFLHARAATEGQEPGIKRVLRNEQVNADTVDEAFRELRDAVKGRPQDTVVVFLAGHAEVFDGRFHLLLPSFAFRHDAGAAQPAEAASLPYTAVYRNLVRLGALRRMVVIDACQAAAVGDDKGVRLIRQMIDGGSRRARTAYLLAARQGEPAGEVSELKHGLFTYALLRGMDAPGLEPAPKPAHLDELADADRDHDGVVATDELRWYANWAVPRLASTLTTVVMRQGVSPREGTPRSPSAVPRIEASDTAFPLITLPGKRARNP
jgi:WD40 repeat protein/uncharacterized caspase-like protein